MDTVKEALEALEEADRLEAEAIKLNARATEIRKRTQTACAHPYSKLVFSSGATTSYLGDRVEFAMRVNCTLCGGHFNNKLVLYKDL